jgi:hypothetical protein
VADGVAELERMIERVREIGRLPERAAPKVAVALDRELVGNVRRGVGPDGSPWPATKDGHTPLQGAPESLDVRVEGKTRIRARLTGIHARHHLGWGRGGVRRPILPTALVPDPMVRAIRRACEAEFIAITGEG